MPRLFARSTHDWLYGSLPTACSEAALDKEGVFFARAKEIRVEASPGSLEFTVDGEVIGDEPAVFAAIPRALKVIVGPEYVPEPAK